MGVPDGAWDDSGGREELFLEVRTRDVCVGGVCTEVCRVCVGMQSMKLKYALCVHGIRGLSG